ncbi:MAG: hypothetical protein ABIT23_10700 [Nitrosospira sp.]
MIFLYRYIHEWASHRRQMIASLQTAATAAQQFAAERYLPHCLHESLITE